MLYQLLRIAIRTRRQIFGNITAIRANNSCNQLIVIRHLIDNGSRINIKIIGIGIIRRSNVNISAFRSDIRYSDSKSQIAATLSSISSCRSRINRCFSIGTRNGNNRRNRRSSRHTAARQVITVSAVYLLNLLSLKCRISRNSGQNLSKRFSLGKRLIDSRFHKECRFCRNYIRGLDMAGDIRRSVRTAGVARSHGKGQFRSRLRSIVRLERLFHQIGGEAAVRQHAERNGVVVGAGRQIGDFLRCASLDEGRCEILAERQHLLIRDSFQIVENMLGIGRVGLERVELGLLYSRIIVGSLVVAGSYRYGSFGLGYIRNSDTKRIRGGGADFVVVVITA